MTLTLDQARTIIATARAKGREAGMKPLSVVVLDAGGHVLAFEREDGSPSGRFAIAFGKAHGAVMMGVPSRRLGEMAVERPHFIAAAGGAFDGKMVPVAGGVLLRDATGALVGAVGISGDTSDNDALAGVAGAEAAGLTAEA
ncbi:GlcG/HbpS family heme-binding protein [Pararhodobacter marinus]|uniref:Glcg protein n=1 Tax=Pararhodobacter marinus TaxID=2184063 RepID=A0A2U2C684_9RHOB|nr:heme-binding protein [Pararhodobacter marinus]PWE27390.1 glcg protein [Pararhodobacter marinus]